MPQKEPNHDNNCLYFDITKQERDSAVRYLLGTILKSRQASKFPSNYYTFDEDVNVYMAHLMFAVSLPEYHEMADPYLSLNSSDILEWVRGTEDRTIRYFIFKVNADYLLMHTAIFDDLNGKDTKKSVFTKSQRHYRELAKLYYDQAAAYHRRIYRKKTGVGEVLGKLSEYFESYQSLLQTVKRDYFEFMNGFRDNAFAHFVTEISQYEGESKKKELMDQFLDVYGRWLATKQPDYASRTIQLAEELKKWDPKFKFDAKEDLYLSGGWNDDRKCA